MTLEISLKGFSLLAQLAQLGRDKPPSGTKGKIHWVGQKTSGEQKQPEQGGKPDGGRSKKKDARGYRELSSITLGEINEAYNHYAGQLIPSPTPAWLAPNYFAMVHLASKVAPRPPAVFGRVKTCYPSDGYAQNIQELELSLPNRKRQPDVLHLRANDISFTSNPPVQSYCVRVHFLAAPEDQIDFAGQDHLFLQHGFFPEFHSNFIDLLEVNEQNHIALPWLYVIGSRWFESLPVSIQPEIREKLNQLIHWKKKIFNYHPEYLPREVRSLNRELGLKAGFTKEFFIEPETPTQTVDIVTREFDKLFKRPMTV